MILNKLSPNIYCIRLQNILQLWLFSVEVNKSYYLVTKNKIFSINEDYNYRY